MLAPNGAFARFVLVGVAGFVVDAGIVVVLVAAGVSPFIARIPALSIAILTTWLLNRSISFRVRAPRSREELARYIAVALSSALLNYLLYSALVAVGLGPVLAIAVSTICLMFYSFIGYRHYAFKVRRAS